MSFICFYRISPKSLKTILLLLISCAPLTSFATPTCKTQGLLKEIEGYETIAEKRKAIIKRFLRFKTNSHGRAYNENCKGPCGFNTQATIREMFTGGESFYDALQAAFLYRNSVVAFHKVSNNIPGFNRMDNLLFASLINGGHEAFSINGVSFSEEFNAVRQEISDLVKEGVGPMLTHRELEDAMADSGGFVFQNDRVVQNGQDIMYFTYSQLIDFLKSREVGTVTQVAMTGPHKTGINTGHTLTFFKTEVGGHFSDKLWLVGTYDVEDSWDSALEYVGFDLDKTKFIALEYKAGPAV